jgi:hypothetical protein
MLDLRSFAAIADRYPDFPPVHNFVLGRRGFELDRRRYLIKGIIGAVDNHGADRPSSSPARSGFLVTKRR